MAGIYYWIPDSLSLEREQLADLVGIGGISPGDWTISERINLPAGQEPAGLEGPGRLCYPNPVGGIGSATTKLGKQVWRRLGNFAAGILLDDPPQPEELLRNDAADAGLPIEDEFGRRWVIPVAYDDEGPGATLPVFKTFGGEGQVNGEVFVSSKWRPYFTLGTQMWDWLQQYDDWRTFDAEAAGPEVARPEQPNGDDLLELAFQVVARQYRLGAAAHNVLAEHGVGLLNLSTAISISHAVTDFHFIRKVQQNPPTPAS